MSLVLSVRFFRRKPLAVLLLILFVVAAVAQDSPSTKAPSPSLPATSQSLATPAEASPAAPEPSRAVKLTIGPGDEVEITVYGVADLSQKTRVNSSGEITLALIGSVRVAGLSAEEAAADIERRLVEGGYLKDPHVTVFVKEYATQNITVAGEVAKPGVFPAVPQRKLLELLTAAGGLTQQAGKTVVITHASRADQPQTIILSDDPVLAAQNNVDILPGDTVVVSRAGIVYVIGEVNRAGGFVMENSKTMTVSQALAMASGPSRMAALNKSRILRRTSTGLQNIQLPIKDILAAKAPDVPLQADDILFVPGSKGKMALERGSGSMLSLITGLAIYRF